MSRFPRIEIIYRAIRPGLDSLRENLMVGWQLALPIRTQPERVKASLGQFILLICSLWLLSAFDDLLNAGWGAEYSLWGVLSLATISYLWIATLAVIVLLDRRSAEFLRLGVSTASVLVIITIAWTVTTNAWSELHVASYQKHFQSIWEAFLIWEVIAFARIVSHVFGAAWYRTISYALLYGFSVYATLIYLPHTQLFAEPPDTTEHVRFDVEATYYAQENLLRQNLYSLSPQRPGIVDLYFVGFGAYGYQDVFRREVEQATIIFEQQFNSIGRTVSLINNHDTVATLPMANRHNLEKTIRDLAARIDSEEDIVVLFLSSHGAEDATISVALADLQLNDLAASEVRQILDTAAIKWRIVIVSACYSGSFIDALASPTTLVITAAAKDRASFGCAHENDWTYFGEAYFNQALKGSPSFVTAFTLAQEIITKRENAEGKESSNPKISLGDEIGAYLIEQGL